MTTRSKQWSKRLAVAEFVHFTYRGITSGLMEIEGDPSFRDGSSKVRWRQWPIIYKDVLKVPWDDVALQFRQKTRARVGVI
jgi:hypothetical protein